MAISIKAIMEAFKCDKGTATVAYNLMKGKIPPQIFASVRKMEREAHNKHRDETLVMEALDECLNCFGVECSEGRYIDHYHQNIQIEYLNLGDSYDTTIIYDNERQCYVLDSWGNFVERHPRRFPD